MVSVGRTSKYVRVGAADRRSDDGEVLGSCDFDVEVENFVAQARRLQHTSVHFVIGAMRL